MSQQSDDPAREPGPSEHAIAADLAAANDRLRATVAELERTRRDLHDLLDCTEIATVIVDDELRVLRCSEPARRLLDLDEEAVGRRLTEAGPAPLLSGLVDDADHVRMHGDRRRADVAGPDATWIDRCVMPHRGGDGFVVTFTDVTHRRAAAEEAGHRAERLELAWDVAHGGVYEHNVPLDDSIWISEQWARTLGFRVDELPSHDRLFAWIEERTHPDDRAVLRAARERFLDGRDERYRVEIRLRHRRGHWLWVRAMSRALQRDPDGRVTRVLGMMIDITDLKETEAALRESESRFRDVTDGLPLIVWVHDEVGEQEFVNATFCEYFGVSRQQMIEERWRVFLHPDDEAGYTAAFAASIRERRPFHAEARVRVADGSWRWIESWGRPRWSGDRFRGFVGTSADITERKALEESLRETGERFRTLADHVAQLVWMADGEGSVFWFNRRWYEFTGADPAEVEGWGWTAVHHPDHVDRVVAKVAHCYRTGQVWEDTFPLRSATGTYRWFLSRAIPIRDDAGRVIRWFGTNTDITEERELEQRLREADRQKNEFLAVLGHELRNPLAAIRNAADVLAMLAGGDERLVQLHGVLARQSTHMTRLLDGLLDVSRIVRGKIALQREPTDLAAVCRQVVADLHDRVGETRRTTIELPDRPVWIAGDAVRLTQVIDNLLSNAVNHTAAGGRITLRLTADGDRAELVVSDDGEGIDPSFLPHVFEIFRQSEQNLDRGRGGLGLGLALVKHLVELHGGEVHAHSAGIGAGARFAIRVPCTDERPHAREPEREGPTGLRILLVEDNPDAAAMMRTTLELSGHRVEQAADGEAALRCVARSLPDVVLCDLGLPGGMTGYDVAAHLRAEPRTRAVPRIALSGYGRPVDRERSAAAGFDEHLTKPLGAAEIGAALRKVLAHRSPPSA